ncbi:peptide chain release factor N(5)-glutamine methyltransferase [Eubacterium barkeri]|nr:peptide chain release factor N(5)-glutamine methyltransferase [Eubacterium barkeri]
MMTITDALKKAVYQFNKAEIPQPRLEAEILLDAVLGCGRVYFYSHPDHPLTEEDVEGYEALIQRRCAHEPTAYILGKKEFMGLDFIVSPAVLIPRPDTETVVNAALAQIPGNGHGIRVLDLCTGSGAIGLSIKKYRPEVDIVLGDISPGALAIATENANALGLKAELVQSDLFDNLQNRRFHLIVSNPPYIPREILLGLALDVQGFEPHLALDGGNDGFELYNRIIQGAPNHLVDGGRLLFEAGDGQAGDLAQHMVTAGFTIDTEERDLIGVLRAVGGYKNSYKEQ